MENEPILQDEEKKEETLFGASEELLAQIKDDLDAENVASIRTRVRFLQPADVADLINRLSGDQRRSFVGAIRPVLDPEVVTYIEENIREEILDILGVQGFAKAVSKLDSDDALDLIADLDEDQMRAVLRAIPAGERAFLEEVLTYPEDSAGRLMQREIVTVPPFWTIGETIHFVHETADLPDTFYTIYVVDPRHHPIGQISLSNLLREEEMTLVSEVMDKTLNLIPAVTDQEEVAGMFRHYALVSAPVVDPSGRIVGMITVDDIVTVIDEEAEEDILKLAKAAESDFTTPVAKTAYWRIRWLIITLVNTLMASYVISTFETSIQKMTALSFLMTINAAMGGNSGMQVVTVVVRALAMKDIKETDAWKAVRKEILVGLMTGTFFAFILGGVAALWVQDLQLGIVLSVALLLNMLWAACAGTLFPIVIQRLKLDPAISAGPILTTTTDVLGYFIFLGLATWFLL